ncbi:MAG: hypothetical protein RBS80_27510 [Thermoguttaceae bacterium]|jgi:hypothetical protein|nr:hypothetical protein [Thermoguttaceae bacterium]
MRRHVLPTLSFLAIALVFASHSLAGQLFVGAATADITPEGPTALRGQFRLRIAKTAETPLSAGVVALESRDGDKSLDVAVMVACDLISIPDEVRDMVREEVAKRLPGLDVKKIFIGGTHTHTAPAMTPGSFVLPEEGVLPIKDYRDFVVGRLADAIEKAWNNRAPGSATWGLGHAVVAYNRRAVYANGSARMYGATNVPEFRGIEGYEDHSVNTFFFWNGEDKLIAMCINVPCPSQVVEGRSTINADYWYPVYKALRERYGEDLCILGWCGAAGDQAPRPMFRKEAEGRMTRLRGLDALAELARRIVQAVDDTYEVVKGERQSEVPLVHHVETLQLPMRLVTEAEYAESKAAQQRAADAIAKDPKAADSNHTAMNWHGRTVNRFEAQKDDPNPTHETELHVLRIGDAVVCTNQFELFTDFGIQMKGRSKAIQTFVVQLVGGGTYLPTERAVRGGSYSAIVQSNRVGPEGGQVLVDKTVEAINAVFAEK